MLQNQHSVEISYVTQRLVQFYTVQEKLNFTELFQGLHLKQHVKRMHRMARILLVPCKFFLHSELQLDESKISIRVYTFKRKLFFEVDFYWSY